MYPVYGILQNKRKKIRYEKETSLTPCARTFMKGTTPSEAMHWRMRGEPYKPPMQLEMEEMYRPARNRNLTMDTC